MIFGLIRKRNGNWRDDTLSGLTVALALVPEAIAFSFIAGVGPLVGLWAAVFMGLITSGFGGRPGMISGATGAALTEASEINVSLTTLGRVISKVRRPHLSFVYGSHVHANL